MSSLLRRLAPALVLAACAPGADVRPTPAARAPEAPTIAAPSPSPSVAAAEAPRRALTLITDRAALRALEARGHGLGERLDGAAAESNAAAIQRPRFAALVRAVEAEVNAVRVADSLAGVGIGDKPHRLIDMAWLRAADARFELSGVANRLDRAPFHAGSCAEVRLAYRLAYSRASEAGLVTSKLPATISLEFVVPRPEGEADCRAAARAWQAPADLRGEALAEWLTSAEGPLDPERFGGYRLHNVNINVQTVRWPSTVRPMMAGHAEYLLQTLRPDAGGGLSPRPLENTPDVARIRADRRLRQDLLDWIRAPENLAAIDAGTAALPERFLATRAISVSPRGLARRQNRPFRQIFKPKDLVGMELGQYPRVKSPAALIRRLDQFSCQGCHQSRSVAGFHLMGEEPAEYRGANGLAVAASPHLTAELTRRAALTEAVARGAAPDYSAPFAERADGEQGRNAHCGLGEAGFAGWTCGPGLRCVEDDSATDDREVGVCAAEGAGEAGDPCEVARVTPDENGRRDGVAEVLRRSCVAGAVCDKNEVGFPGGMCVTSCDEAAAGGRGVCGGIPVLTAFNDCLARRVPFEQCIAENVRPAGLAACDAGTPCRDDYVCARTGAGKGACMPPYFLFQLRVDGHPSQGPGRSR